MLKDEESLTEVDKVRSWRHNYRRGTGRLHGGTVRLGGDRRELDWQGLPRMLWRLKRLVQRRAPSLERPKGVAMRSLQWLHHGVKIAAVSNAISPLSKGNYKLLPRLYLASYFRMHKEEEFEILQE